MKYVGLLASSLAGFAIILANFYYNSVTLDMQKIKDYVVESNIILEEVVNEEEKIIQNKDGYISRLQALKEGINNSKTTFLIEEYKENKIKSIESLMSTISESDINELCLDDVNKYNDLCDKEIDKLIINR